MDVSRRDLIVAGAVALGASGMVLGGFTSADASDEAAVADQVETLRKGLLEADRSKLEQVASTQISYGHSDGRVETKEQFIHGVMTQKAGRQAARLPRAEGDGRRQRRDRAAHLSR